MALSPSSSFVSVPVDANENNHCRPQQTCLTSCRSHFLFRFRARSFSSLLRYSISCSASPRWLLTRDSHLELRSIDWTLTWAIHTPSLLSRFPHCARVCASVYPTWKRLKEYRERLPAWWSIRTGNEVWASRDVFSLTTMHASKTIFENGQLVDLSKFFEYRSKIVFF